MTGDGGDDDIEAIRAEIRRLIDSDEDWAKVAALSEELFAIEPDKTAARFAACGHEETGNLQAALQWADRLVDLAASAPDSLHMRGEILRRLNDARAEADLRGAYAGAPQDDLIAASLLGYLARPAAGEVSDEALELCDVVSAMSEVSIPSLALVSNVLWRAGRIDRARVAFDAMLARARAIDDCVEEAETWHRQFSEADPKA